MAKPTYRYEYGKRWDARVPRADISWLSGHWHVSRSDVEIEADIRSRCNVPGYTAAIVRQSVAYALICHQLVKSGFAVRYVELWGDPAKRKKKAASKTKYTCPGCGLNAWGKPELNLVCGDCEARMEAEPAGEGEDDS